MNNIRLTLIVLLFSIALVGSAGVNEERVEKANKDYSAGLYANAIEGYESVLKNGYESAEVYYNLGNAYFKSDDLASAILYYEKAKKLRPNDSDVLFNLNVANNRIKDKIETVPVLFYKRWWQQTMNWLSTDAWTRFHITCWIVFLAAASFYFISRMIIIRKIAFWIGLVMLLLSLVTFGAAWQDNRSNHQMTEAIVFDPSLTVKSSPSENSVDLFVVHEGTKVAITDQLGDWYEIRIANGSTGWIQHTAVRSI
ncbi:MAG: tetratricopeptide repeat protein [Bacteroidales bacterium]|nr:tetratricopeptide repeat protein [Bacteroidales bacterium]